MSKAQFHEVQRELKKHYPSICLEPIFIDSFGDKNLSISLRTLDKTDFFTRELDQMLLQHQCRIAIHSAKDLPEPLPEGLKVVAITTGVDSSDSLVMRKRNTLGNLKHGALIATSSARREEAVKQLRADFRFTDIRGTIEQRLTKLENREVDGVVIAEAALIRLNLTHLNRVTLPGETTPLQGQLAIVARSDDKEMENHFACLDSRIVA